MAYCNKVGQEVHLSTQLNISNAEALKFYAQFADVVVLARELNLKQVRKIYDAIQQEGIKGPMGEPVRIEMFCHGALCMAVSGKCYLSLHELNASANRGACMQVCRRSYTVRDKETDVELEVDNQYIMSPKDLKTIHFMNKMLDAGVRVFKIEGRARGPEYVRTVVECYKEAIGANAGRRPGREYCPQVRQVTVGRWLGARAPLESGRSFARRSQARSLGEQV
jgi:putative protease